MGAPQAVIHLVAVLGLEACHGLNVDSIGGEADQHGNQQPPIIQHPGFPKGLLRHARMLGVFVSCFTDTSLFMV